MSDKLYIIPDIHERVLWIEDCIKTFDANAKIVFLGDYFDSYTSTRESVHRTAEWLKYSLYQPNRIHIWGNHDLWYGYPQAEELICSGNNLEKNRFINTILKRADWDKLVLYVKEQNFYISHGGLHRHHFEHPVLGISDEWLKNSCETALEQAKSGLTNPILRAGFNRGGRQPVGGISWLCWGEFVAIPHINQIVGHTCDKDIRYKYCPNKKHAHSTNICLDTNCRYIGILEDGKFNYIGNPILGDW